MRGRAMIVVAAGASSRFGADKMMAPIGGIPLVMHTVTAVSPLVSQCVLVCRPDQVRALEGIDRMVTVVPGGETRTGSELAGLAVLSDDIELIGIHDGARPRVSTALIETLFTVADEIGGAVPVLEPGSPVIRRFGLAPVLGARLVQTPQVFRAEPLLAAYREAARLGFVGHDTTDVAQAFSDLDIAAVEGDPANIKVTFTTDLDAIRRELGASRSEPR